MKLSEYKNDYYQFTSLASNTSRQLAFAGIALIWIFKTQSENGFALPNELLIPSLGLIISLGADLLQYISGSLIWGAFHRYHENRRCGESDPELEAPVYFNWPGIVLFYTKVVAVLASYYFLFSYALNSISFQ